MNRKKNLLTLVVFFVSLSQTFAQKPNYTDLTNALGVMRHGKTATQQFFDCNNSTDSNYYL